MKILSLDLSSKASGYAIIEDRTLITSGVLKASDSDAIVRIQKISKALSQIMQDNLDIDVIAVEEVRPEDANGSRKNLHTHKILMYVQAAVVFLTRNLLPNAKVEYLYPSEWRAECGIKNGRGIYREQQKKFDIAFVQNTFGIDVDDDEADAIGIGVAYAKKHDN